MRTASKMPGVRANVTPYTKLVKRPKQRHIQACRKSFTFVGFWGCGNKAARRIIPLLVPLGDKGNLTCEWLQRVSGEPGTAKRYNRDGWPIIRALDLMREGEKPPKPEPGLHGATERNPVLVMTVKKSPEGHFIRLDLHLGKNDFETAEFVPKDFDRILVETAGTGPAALERYEVAIQKGRGSPLSDCFRAAVNHAAEVFGIVNPTMGIAQDRQGGVMPYELESGYSESPTAHPLQRWCRCELTSQATEPEKRHPKDRRRL